MQKGQRQAGVQLPGTHWKSLLSSPGGGCHGGNFPQQESQIQVWTRGKSLTLTSWKMRKLDTMVSQVPSSPRTVLSP